MNNAGLDSLDRSVQLAHEWIDELDDALGWNNRPRAFRLLRAVLEVLRDCLPLAEVAHFSAQLPVVVRGAFFEHWKPEGAKPRHWDLDRFFMAVDSFFPHDPLDETAAAVTTVFGLIANHVSIGEIDHVRNCLPKDIRDLWPNV